MSAIVNKIESILTSEYSTQNFVELMQEIFDSMKIVAPNNFHEERSNFSSHIVGRIHVGNYTAPEGKKIAIFAVQLKKENYVEGSRSIQRSYAKKLIEGGNCDAAIVAFYTEGEPKWRLSFVRLDYEMKIEKGKLKTTENITPAKRYSFLVGKDEPSHTAIDRFRQFIIDQNSNPSLDDLEEAFSVEKVTKEFFDLYCEKFYQLQEYLDANEDFVEESKRCGFTSEQYAKKLMGQIVFLYFLQKKGWLGVSVWAPILTEKEYKNVYFVSGAQGRIIKEHLPKIYIEQPDGTYRLNSKALDMISDDDEEVIANHMVRKKTWGDGSKKFLRTIFDYSKTHKGHFFENYLEPLFYDTLNKNRGAMGYCPALHARVPFLSGGLFEPLDGYDWKSNCFDIPDEIFSNKQDANDRNADGILDIFDRYNFTMSEDEPMEREVAIDPEMLGKIFENLLEVKDRKSKGAFYTPREIVHYMCQESLINYLVRKTNISEDALRDFILYGDFMKDEDTVKSKREGNGGMYISDEIFKINEEGNIVVNRLKDIDDALASVRVADPAVGSGAFPLGMVNEIVRARENITAYITIGMNTYNKMLLYKNERSPYALKFNAIRNSIFAVDIEPSAVDITQLRLWLSLVIDDEITPEATNELEGHKNPLPLPNLECNILCGNSLIDEFEGVKLVNESDILHTTHEGSQMVMGQSQFDTILEKLLQTQDELFLCDDPNKKIQLKEYIQSYKDMIIHNQFLNQGATDETKEAYKVASKMASKPFTLWQLDFARVFRDNGGFDIVIGNPPYIEFKKLDTFSKEIYKRRFESANGKYDIYVVFMEYAKTLLNGKGTLSFINPTMFMKRDYGKSIRSFMNQHFSIKTIVDFSDKQMFESATTYTGVFVYSKYHCKENCVSYYRLNQDININGVGALYTAIRSDLFDAILKNQAELGEVWSFDDDADSAILKKIQTGSTPLKEMSSSIFQGIASGKDEVFYVDESTIQEYDLERDLLKKLYKGKDIKRYKASWSGYHVLYPYIGNKLVDEDTLKAKYPNIYGYLCDSRDLLRGRSYFDKSTKKWYELWNQRNSDNFEELEKIITAEINKNNNFFLDTEKAYGNTKIYTIILKENYKQNVYYVLGLLNSNVLEYFYKKNSVPKAGGFYAYKTQFMEILPIKNVSASSDTYLEIVNLTKKLCEQYDAAVERDLNKLVYGVYGLTMEEIEIVEGAIQ